MFLIGTILDVDCYLLKHFSFIPCSSKKHVMESLLIIQEDLIRQTSLFRRYLSDEIDWTDRLFDIVHA